MSSSEAGIYLDSKFQGFDIGALMREGHPDIVAGDRRIVTMVRAVRRDLGRPLRILDVGSGSGHLSLLLAREFAEGEIIANEVADAAAAQARAKLAAFPHARIVQRPFGELKEQVDVVISWGSHHHLGHDYLAHVCDVLAPDGVLIIGDEMCPEYLTPADQQRLSAAETIRIVDGYIFDRTSDIQIYRESGLIPDWNQQLELARRQALWQWYKFVGDYALARNAWEVLTIELQIARDDLITNFAEEHKTSPFLLERELELNGFSITERTKLGNRPPALQSFVLYTCRPPSVKPAQVTK